MKNNFIKYIVSLFILISFVACDFDTTLKTAALDSELQINNAATIATSENQNSTILNVNAISGGVKNEKDQVVSLTFANGYIDDSATNLANIKFYKLSDAATTTTAYTRTALTVKDVYVAHKNGNSIVYATLDLDIINLSTVIEVEVAAAITADGGNKTLNQDADAVPGETTEDLYFNTIAVSDTNTTVNYDLLAPTTGLSRSNPQNTFTLNMGINADWDLEGTPSSFDWTSFTNAGLAGTILVEKFDLTTKSWNSVTVTTSYDNSTGVFKIDIPSPAAGDLYRWGRKDNTVTQQTTGGYAHKVSTDNALGFSFKSFINVNNSTNTYYLGGVTTATDFYSEDDGNNAVKVTFTVGTGNIIDSTVTANAFNIFVTPSGGEKELVGISSIQKITNNTYVLYLNKTIDKFSDSTTKVSVEAFPVIKTDMGTSTDTTDDRFIGDTTKSAARIESNVTHA